MHERVSGPLSPFLPYARQSLEEADIEAVTAVLRGDWWTTGPMVGAFEEAFAAACGAPHAVAVANGTAALHVASLALGLGPGDLAVVPDVTFAATANGPRLAGADVLLADVDADTGLMTPATLSAALDAAPRPVSCVLPVHLAGQVADIGALKSVARAHPAGRDARFVEDACHAIGTVRPDGTVVGAANEAEAVTFSFHPVKTLACGEGGMVTTGCETLAERVRHLSNHAVRRDPSAFVGEGARDGDGEANPWYYEVSALGLNYRLSDIHAALGRSQLSRLAAMKARRSALARAYDTALAPLAPLVRPMARVPCDPCWHLYVTLIDFAAAGRDRASLMRALRARGIGSQVHYIPLHRHPTFAGPTARLCVERPCDAYAGAEAFYARCLSLPLFPAMQDGDVARVVEAVAEWAAGRD